MNSNELYEEFLKHCREYEIDLYGIVIKRGDTWLKIMKPANPDSSTYLIYELIEKSRVSGVVKDLNELLELCIETFGEDSIIKRLWL